MTDQAYRPLDVSEFRNAGLALLPDEQPLTGAQHLRGLPFLIGEGERAFIGLGDTLGGRVTLPIDATAHTVIVAHRLLQSHIEQGAPVGIPVADYVFHLADGAAHHVQIRERFEISAAIQFGQLPFVCESDTTDWLLPRWSGPWELAGERQTEVNRGWPRNYFLWCWTNPAPEVRILSLEVVPRGPRFLIAGITLGLTPEYPFVREAAVPVRIDLKDPELAARPLDASSNLRVTVDRGVAGYPYPLPATADNAFVGWGEARNPGSTPAYARIAAVPSATLAVRLDNTDIDAVRWGDLTQQGAAETPRVRLEVLEDGRNWVETVVVDDATGQPIPCRIHFRSAAGVPYQPHGHHDHVNSDHGTWHVDVGGDLRLGGLSYAYIDGRCQGWLPRGDVIVDVARGYEYAPLRERVTIAPGQQRLELRLRRWTSMNQQRWFSGDTHVHFLSTQGSLREAQCEDLNVVNLLQSQWGSLFTNTEDFTGEPVSSRDGRTVVWTNQENRQHLLGHLILLGLRQPVYPWCSDGPDEAELGGALETTLSAWADACHAQGGTVILPHFPNPNAEPATLVATGRADAVEMINSRTYNHLEYYRYLNAGYRLPLVGGTDKMGSDVAVGQYRTYVSIPPDEDFSYASWTRNLRLGRTFMSGGPLLELSVDGADVGDTIRLPRSGGTVEVTARARSILPVHTLQIVARGEVVAQTDSPTLSTGLHELSLSTRVRVDGDTWLCARAGGSTYSNPAPHHDVWNRGVFAHTSPIYVTCGDGDWQLADRSGLQYMLTLVEGSLAYLRERRQQTPDRVSHHHGEADHQAFLERPFVEALAALQARLTGSAMNALRQPGAQK